MAPKIVSEHSVTNGAVCHTVNRLPKLLYLGQFKAILNQLGVILGPFVDPLGTILGRFWGYLAQFEPILNHFGIILGPFSSYLEHIFFFWNIFESSITKLKKVTKKLQKAFGQTDFFNFQGVF